jgi:NADH-quinone oxidoreductase subunit A
MADSYNVFVPIMVMMVIAVVLYAGALLVAHLLSPKKPSRLKSMPYECGEEPVGTAWSQFNVRFYVVGLIFIIFDVESVLMFPVAVVFKKMMNIGLGGYTLIVFISFILVLVEGIAYCWKKGDLDWVKSFNRKINNENSEIK